MNTPWPSIGVGSDRDRPRSRSSVRARGVPRSAPVTSYPERFGPFVLVRPLGSGGMGNVTLAVSGQRGAERLCVVKRLLPPHRNNPEFLRRFRDEAELARRLSHGNLVETLSLGQVAGEPYIAQAFVEGHDLQELLMKLDEKGERLPVPLAVYIARELARGLAFAHDFENLNLVHRDVSPANVRLSYAGEVKLLDFGLATSVLKMHVTEPGSNWGKIAYMAPEQITDSDLDRRTDIYSLGVLLWELLTGDSTRGLGSEPHSGRNDLVAAIVRNARRPLPSPSKLNSQVPAGLDAVVLKAAAPAIGDRYTDAGQLRTRLAPFLPADFNAEEALSELLARLFGRERERVARAELVDRARDLLALPETAHEEMAPPDILDGRFSLGRALGETGLRFARDRANHRPLLIRTTSYRGEPAMIETLETVSASLRDLRPVNVLAVTDVGVDAAGLIYFAMEHGNGSDPWLALDLSSGRPAREEHALRIALDVCRGLESLVPMSTRLGDLEVPGRILVSRGRQRDELTAVLVGADILTVAAGLGSPAQSSDVSGVGRLLFALLSGRRYVDGAEPLAVGRPELSVDTGVIVKRAIADEYGSISDLRKEILVALTILGDPVAGGDPETDREGEAALSGGFEPSTKPFLGRRSRRAVMVGAIVCACLAGGAIAGHLRAPSATGGGPSGPPPVVARAAAPARPVEVVPLAPAEPSPQPLAVVENEARPPRPAGESAEVPAPRPPPEIRARSVRPSTAPLPARAAAASETPDPPVARVAQVSSTELAPPAPQPLPDGRALLETAQEAFQRDDLDEAIEKARRAAKAGAGADAQMIIGNILFKRAQYAQAEKAYAEAVRLDPSDTRASQRLERVRVLLGGPAADQNSAGPP